MSHASPPGARRNRALALTGTGLLIGILGTTAIPGTAAIAGSPIGSQVPAAKAKEPRPDRNHRMNGSRFSDLQAPPAPASVRPTQPKRSKASATSTVTTKAAISTGTSAASTQIKAAAALVPARTKTWGSGTQRTLVLYDTTGSWGFLGELYAVAGGTLATHFGQVTAMPVADYTAGAMTGYTAVMYFGSTYNEVLPTAFIADVNSGTTPVIWSGFNVWQLSGTSGTAQATAFTTRYGWDASTSYIDTVDTLSSVNYKGQNLTRDTANNLAGVLMPHIVTPATVTVLGSAICGGAAAPTTCNSIAQTSGSTAPWAIKSANLTYLGEIPFSYMTEADRYLAFADLLYGPLGAGRAASKQAAVRLEDVSPASDPVELRAYADYLSSQGVPFQVAVIPQYLDPTGLYNAGVAENLTLNGTQAFVSALKYMVSKGGVLVQHGTTHQYSTLNNPYDQVSGDDFEFIQAKCSTTANPPLTYVPCTSTTWVQLVGPLPGDSAASTKTRVTQGRNRFTSAGLTAPTIFEVPHYSATAASYAGIKGVYNTRYERSLFYGGALLGGSNGKYFGQFFPYSVTDVYGSKIIPENLGNYEPEAINNHPPRLPADIIANAAANTAVTESTASFFFHPYYPISELQTTVAGIKALGYTFVGATSLK